ncbi:MAG: hypothetical protein NZZ41_02075 [Candidatus Dojkabacteria bacterium]|nr:hypothetical protein [Candidatus Dojkabacteria bacterium]
MKRSENISNIAYLNLALTLTKAFLIMLLIVFTLISIEDQKEKGISKKAELIIELSWEENSLNDLDLFLLTPEKETIFYSYKENKKGTLILERDNRGFNNKDNIPERNEIISFRSLDDGDYFLSVLLYDVHGDLKFNPGDILINPIKFTVKIIRLNPSVETLYFKSFEFKKMREEIKILKFSIKDGNLNIFENKMFDSIVGKVYPPSEFSQN